MAMMMHLVLRMFILKQHLVFAQGLRAEEELTLAQVIKMPDSGVNVSPE